MSLILAVIILAFLIVLHHIYIHDNYDFPDRAFQVSDVKNHETYVIACFAFAAGMVVGLR